MIPNVEPGIGPGGPGGAGVRPRSGGREHRQSPASTERPKWTTRPRPATVHAVAESATGSRSDLFKEPVPFQGRSLEGRLAGDDSKELARSLDADVPVEDLLPVEPLPDGLHRSSIVISDPVLDVRDDNDALIERRAAYARNVGGGPDRKGEVGPGGDGGRTQAQARKTVSDRWASSASTSRNAPISFGDHPGRIPTLVEHETPPRSDPGHDIVDPYRGLHLPDTLDRSHPAHCIPEFQGWKPERTPGFGRGSTGWNERSFSCRERVLHALSNGESLNLVRMAALAPDLEGCRTASGTLPSSQYRAMVRMIADSGRVCRHARWHVHDSCGGRLLQLVEMLDHAAAVV